MYIPVIHANSTITQLGELPLEELLDKYNMQQQYSMTHEGSVQESPKDDFNEGWGYVVFNEFPSITRIYIP